MPGTELDQLLGRIKRWFAPGDADAAAGRLPAGQEAGASGVVAADLVRIWRRDLDACAREQGGAIAARARAATLISQFGAMNAATRLAALREFSTQLKPDVAAIDAAHARFAAARGAADEWQAEAALRNALESPRARVLRLIGSAFGGVRFLVGLRAQLLELLPANPELGALEAELQAQLADWFDVGFLELRRIGWESPAHILEKLMQYEAVHEIHSWTDMKNRLDGDRRVYAFFHPRLRDEPLVFVEVALTADIAGNVQALLDESAPVFDTRRARAAMFYSISSTQNGLRGISFGNFLIKRVVEDLKRDFPKLEHFVTLSPVPGFAKWLAKQEVPAALRTALGSDWRSDPKLVAEMRAPMMSLLAAYLVHGKSRGRPLDPVARFHLGNGARLERVHWMADTSAKGFAQSHALMVNYYYDLDEIEANLERFDADGTVAASGRVTRLAEVGQRMLEKRQRATA